jgi:hypothetical protein
VEVEEDKEDRRSRRRSRGWEWESWDSIVGPLVVGDKTSSGVGVSGISFSYIRTHSKFIGDVFERGGRIVE